MEWNTHMASGILFGYYVTHDWKGALVGGIAGVIPDIDEPQSKFGKYIPFASYPLKKTIGHRTLTHSLLFAILCSAILLIATQEIKISLAFGVGIIAHALGDMLTGTVQFFYPYKKKIGIRIPYFLFKVIDYIAYVVIMGLIFYETAKYFM